MKEMFTLCMCVYGYMSVGGVIPGCRVKIHFLFLIFLIF